MVDKRLEMESGASVRRKVGGIFSQTIVCDSPSLDAINCPLGHFEVGAEIGVDVMTDWGFCVHGKHARQDDFERVNDTHLKKRLGSGSGFGAAASRVSVAKHL